MRSITAVVLAAGRGKRFWPLTGNKVLFPFFGRTFFDWAVADALPRRLDRVVIVSDPTSATLFRSLSLPCPTSVVIQEKPGSMADAIRTAGPKIGSTSILVVIADDLVETGLYSRVLEEAEKRDVFGLIPAWPAQTYFPGGYLSLRGSRVTAITEKPVKGKEPSKWIGISGQFIREGGALLEALKKVPDGEDAYEKSLSFLMSEKECAFVPYKGAFSSLKYPWNILDVLPQLLGRLAGYEGRNVQIGEGVILKGNVYLEDNVRIFDHTTIIGPAYIGRNTIIGSNNLIRESHIGADSVTGFNTDITRSYIGEGCWFHRNYIGDSVLGNNVSLGAGAALANLRLDEGIISSSVQGENVDTGRIKLGAIIGSDVRIGVNASIMPGVKIGSGSFVGAGVLLGRDLSEGSFCAMKPQYTITPNIHSLSGKRRDNFRKRL